MGCDKMVYFLLIILEGSNNNGMSGSYESCNPIITCNKILTSNPPEWFLTNSF